jgi:hypothetical protein
MSIGFIHSILRNFIMYFGPIVIIGCCLLFNLPNASIYKDSFTANNFYQKASTTLKDFKVPAEFTGDAFKEANLKQTFETNIDTFTGWLNSKDGVNNIPLPLDLSLINKNIPSQITNNPTAQQITDQFNIKIPNNFKSNFGGLRDLFITFSVIYAIAIIALIIVAPLFGKNLFGETGSILQTLSINTLFTLLSVFGVFFISIFSGVFLKQFLPTVLSTNAILELAGGQALYTFAYLLMPVLIFIPAAFVIGLILKTMKTSTVNK